LTIVAELLLDEHARVEHGRGRDLVRLHDAGCVVERGGSLTSLEDLHDRPYREHVLLRDALREVKSTPVRRSISASSS